MTLPTTDAELAAYLTEKQLRPVPGSEPHGEHPNVRRRAPSVPTLHPVPEKPPYWPYKSLTEKRYGALLDTLKYDGQVWHWWYEPCKGLYLAPKLSFTPDFLVQWVPGHPRAQLEFHEVKGAHIYEKDWIRAKQAAAHYHCFRFLLAQWIEGEWHYKDIPAH